MKLSKKNAVAIAISGLLTVVVIATAVIMYTRRSVAPTAPESKPQAAEVCQTLSFESVDRASEGMEISNQFQSTHGVSFRTGPRDSGACASGFPKLAGVGAPKIAHEYFTIEDGISPDTSASIGAWFLTDDGSVARTQTGVSPCTLILDYATTINQASFDLLDVEDGESYEIRAYDAQGQEIAALRQSVGLPAGDTSLNGKPRRVEITSPTQGISRMEIDATGTKPNNVSWGLGFDNLTACKTTADATAEPTITTFTGGASAQCSTVMIYDQNWNLLSNAALSQLPPGSVIRLVISGTTTEGTIDQARFTVNGVQRNAVATKRTGTNEFYDDYTIPAGVTTFSVQAQLHHSTFGWF